MRFRVSFRDIARSVMAKYFLVTMLVNAHRIKNVQTQTTGGCV